jgi:hypothetical protein
MGGRLEVGMTYSSQLVQLDHTSQADAHPSYHPTNCSSHSAYSCTHSSQLVQLDHISEVAPSLLTTPTNCSTHSVSSHSLHHTLFIFITLPKVVPTLLTSPAPAAPTLCPRALTQIEPSLRYLCNTDLRYAMPQNASPMPSLPYDLHLCR